MDDRRLVYVLFMCIMILWASVFMLTAVHLDDAAENEMLRDRVEFFEGYFSVSGESDTDGDGLSDYDEIWNYSSNPFDENDPYLQYDGCNISIYLTPMQRWCIKNNVSSGDDYRRIVYGGQIINPVSDYDTGFYDSTNFSLVKSYNWTNYLGYNFTAPLLWDEEQLKMFEVRQTSYN